MNQKPRSLPAIKSIFAALLFCLPATSMAATPLVLPALMQGHHQQPDAVIATCQPLLQPGPSPAPQQKSPQEIVLRCVPHTLHVAGVALNKQAASALFSGGEAGIKVVPYIHLKPKIKGAN
ncbi:MAG: hypothetical protein M0003_07810 [Acidithiobacillus sp.]|nr:hypothetical protein [Acidithiobacillus sp.]